MDFFQFIFFLLLFHMSFQSPFVINTWAFTNGTSKAWEVISKNGGSALDAVELGCSQCEIEQCDHTVGYGGSPDEDGETTLDALIMDGVSHNVGAVAALRRIKSAISVARKVLENTEHSLLVGDQGEDNLKKDEYSFFVQNVPIKLSIHSFFTTQFAVKMGFKEESLTTDFSMQLWKKWQINNCQPNFWMNVFPDPKEKCGPYKHFLNSQPKNSSSSSQFGVHNHDTIGMIAIDNQGRIAGGTSSNGAKFKIPGRVGDSPIAGSGAYVDQEVGGAAATGDGDVMMRFLPTYNTVENMRRGMTPTEAATDSIKRIVRYYPSFSGAIVAVSMNGKYGAACHGISSFPFSVASKTLGKVVVETVLC